MSVLLSVEEVQTFLSLIAEERIQRELNKKALCIYFLHFVYFYILYPFCLNLKQSDRISVPPDYFKNKILYEHIMNLLKNTNYKCHDDTNQHIKKTRDTFYILKYYSKCFGNSLSRTCYINS